ncbi:unnamed protein product [Lepidochelys kempii]
MARAPPAPQRHPAQPELHRGAVRAGVLPHSPAQPGRRLRLRGRGAGPGGPPRGRRAAWEAGGGAGAAGPGSRKRVRFADALGLELASVRHYWPAELPQVPEHVHTQLRHDALRHFAPLRPFQGTPRTPWRGACRWHHVSGTRWGCRTSGRGWGAQGVCLEGVRAGAMGVAGTLRVLNLAYEKRVSVRYSWDGWASYREAPAAYAGPSAGPPSDRFAFRLPLPPGGTLEFALRCHVGGQELWDNNAGQNYILRGGGRAEGPPSPLQDGDGGWIHFL